VQAYSFTAPNMIAAAFAAIIDRSYLTPRDHELFESHRTSVTRALETRLETIKVEVIGSFARGTAVHGSSDIDLLTVLQKQSVTWGGQLMSSTTVLREVRGALLERYAFTEVGRDGQAVVVAFNDGQHPVDVVPACYSHQGGRYNHPIFLIPDGTGGWMHTSPTSHSRFIRDGDTDAGGQLKYTAQIFKYWRDTRTSPVPLSAFHVELLLAEERLCVGARSYSAIMRDVLALLSNRRGSALHDPVNVSALIPLSGTASKRDQALGTIDAAARHADAALIAERRGDLSEAARQWDIVFNGNFPR
jgi:predicted nucleotidyltransferase